MAPNILIIGGGISGLALAQGLKKHNIAFHIYERDATRDYRAQGYRIRIGREAIDAMQYLFTDETWALFELTCGDMRMGNIPEIDAMSAKASFCDLPQIMPPVPDSQNGESNMPKKGYTVDRTLFREVLIRGLEEHISYGKSLTGYEELPDSVRARFADGSSAEGTLVVGADGSKSVLRKQLLPNHKILDTGGRAIYGKTPLTPELVKSLGPDMMNGMSAIKDRTRSLLLVMVLEPMRFPHRAEMEEQGFHCPDDYIFWVTASQPGVLGLPNDHMPHMNLEESAQLALDVTKNWHPSLRKIVEHQAPHQTALLQINSCDPDLGRWEPNKHVTILGDAIHLTTPAGSGAITALRDSHHLCQLLVKEGQSKETIGKYEAMMRDYASKNVEMSLMVGQKIFGATHDQDIHIGELMLKMRHRRT